MLCSPLPSRRNLEPLGPAAAQSLLLWPDLPRTSNLPRSRYRGTGPISCSIVTARSGPYAGLDVQLGVGLQPLADDLDLEVCRAATTPTY